MGTRYDSNKQWSENETGDQWAKQQRRLKRRGPSGRMQGLAARGRKRVVYNVLTALVTTEVAVACSVTKGWTNEHISQ